MSLHHYRCHVPQCDGMDVDVNTASPTEDDFARLDEALRAHQDSHIVRPEVTHIRKQINPRRIRTGNQFYKDKVKLGPAEDGSQTLCGAEGTIEDMSYGETRHAKNLAWASCGTCKQLRTGRNPS